MTTIVIQEEATTVVVNKSDIKIFEQGTQGAKGDKGDKGDTGDPGADGADGNDGTDGADGADGNTILSGSGAPGSGLGNDGDLYYDTLNSDIYGPKASGSWGSPTSIIGPAGAGAVDSVNGQSGIVDLDADDISDDSTSHKFASSAQLAQIATNQTHAESAHAPSNAEANPATASTAEMELGTETAIRSMSPALVKAAVDEHAGGGGSGLFSELEIKQTTTDDSEVALDLSSFPTVSFNELYLIIVKAIMYASGGAKVDYFEHTYAVERQIGTVAAINPINDPVPSVGENWGKNSGSAKLICSADTANSKPLIKVKGDAATTEYWTVHISYRKMYP